VETNSDEQADDYTTLAGLVTNLGGVMRPGQTFMFDLPLEKVKEVVPKLNSLGIGARVMSEYVTDHPTQLRSPMTVATLEAYRKPEK
jgi:hypothetical protein